MERAVSSLDGLFEPVSAWVRSRFAPWEDRRRAPWATAVSAVGASTRARLGRVVPWVRTLVEEDARLLAGQGSAVGDGRCHHGMHVDGWRDARDTCRVQVLTLVEHVQAGAWLLCDHSALCVACCDTL